MAAGSTYTPIATTTLGSAAASYTFSSIASTYTDLVLIINGKTTASGEQATVRYNSDTGNNYSATSIYGDGSSAASGRSSNISFVPNGWFNATVPATTIIQVQNYSNTTTYKTSIMRSNDTSSYIQANVGLWRSTSAINSIVIALSSGGNWATGTTFTLYGIAAA